MSKKKTADTATQEMLFDVKVEGLRAAYTRAKKILEDDSAPATAHAAIINSMFKAGGLHSSSPQEVEKAPHEMDGYELEAAVRSAIETLKSHKAFGNDDEDDEDRTVFD
jgi:hypothetical protein